MNAAQFHATPVGAKVIASIGNSEHVAKVLNKNNRKRKFLLLFHLANGDSREEWRNASKCTGVPDQSRPMGPTRRHQKYRESLAVGS